VGICLGFWTFRCEETLPSDGFLEGMESIEGDVGELGR